jgi:RNA polymerase sigma factor (sigma-70 family)
VADISDDELYRLYRDGDADAFDALFDRHHISVYNYAFTMLRDTGRAEDAMQEAFLSVARAGKTYQPRGVFRAWLMRIVRNRCLNVIEAERARRTASQTDIAYFDPPSHDPPTPERAGLREEVNLLQQAMTKLPERQREAIALYAFEEMPYREIADVMELPVNTVKTLIYRARAALAEAMPHDEE